MRGSKAVANGTERRMKWRSTLVYALAAVRDSTTTIPTTIVRGALILCAFDPPQQHERANDSQSGKPDE